MPLTADEAEFLLKEIVATEQRRLQTILLPYFAALIEIEGRKPPGPVQLPDGRIVMYRGPTAEEIAGPYKPPGWLEEMAQIDPRLSALLRRYREER